MLNITKGKIDRPVKCVIYGPEGIGKSTLASRSPDALFEDVEGGTAQMDVPRLDRPEKWEKLIADVKEVAATPGICKTLVLDTADWCELLCIKYICEKHKQANLEAFNYGKGYQILSEEFTRLLEALDLVIAAGINVVVTAHAKMRKQELPEEAGSFDRWEMKLTRQVAPLLKEWADCVLFLNYKTLVYTTENDTKKARGGKRVMYTTHNPCWDAKNRHGLPDELDLDYSKIAHIFKGGASAAGKSDSPLEQLKALMEKNGVTEPELQKVVADKDKYPIDTSVAEYDSKFISGWVIKYWDQIMPLITANRNSNVNEPAGFTNN